MMFRALSIDRAVHPVSVHRPSAPQPRFICRADTGGVENLIARDFARKQKNVQPELRDRAEFAEPEGNAAQEKVEPQISNVSDETERVIKSKGRRRQEMAKAAKEGAPSQLSGPKRCKQAIDEGLELFSAKDYKAAIDKFNLALELPGNGAYRMPNSPREFSCPSDAEENAALFNMACAYAQLNQVTSSVTCLEAILDNGFDDLDVIRNDPDLRPVQGTQELKDLLAKYQDPLAQVKKGFMGKFEEVFLGKSKMESDLKKKPWIMW